MLKENKLHIAEEESEEEIKLPVDEVNKLPVDEVELQQQIGLGFGMFLAHVDRVTVEEYVKTTFKPALKNFILEIVEKEGINSSKGNSRKGNSSKKNILTDTEIETEVRKYVKNDVVKLMEKNIALWEDIGEKIEEPVMEWVDQYHEKTVNTLEGTSFNEERIEKIKKIL